MTQTFTSTSASRIIAKCGGHQAVATLVGCKLATVYRWTYPRSKGGTGGTIPAPVQEKLISATRAGLISLVASDFVDLPKSDSEGA